MSAESLLAALYPPDEEEVNTYFKQLYSDILVDVVLIFVAFNYIDK